MTTQSENGRLAELTARDAKWPAEEDEQGAQVQEVRASMIELRRLVGLPEKDYVEG